MAGLYSSLLKVFGGPDDVSCTAADIAADETFAVANPGARATNNPNVYGCASKQLTYSSSRRSAETKMALAAAVVVAVLMFRRK